MVSARSLLLFLITVIFLVPNVITIAGETDFAQKITQVGPKSEQVNLEDYRQVFYVSDQTGSDKQGDGSKEHPWQTINYAIGKIENGNWWQRAFMILTLL